MTGHPGVFAGGDMVPAERTVTVGDRPRQAGRPQHRRAGCAASASSTRRAPDARRPSTQLNTWYYSDAPRTVRPQLELARRASTFDEVVGGLDESNALFEARRCLSCGNCFACDNCYGVCPDNAVIKLDEPGPYALRDRPRLLQGLRPVRRGVPVRGDRDDARAHLGSQARPRSGAPLGPSAQ